jgi:hypothetical protein
MALSGAWASGLATEWATELAKLAQGIVGKDET